MSVPAGQNGIIAGVCAALSILLVISLVIAGLMCCKKDMDNCTSKRYFFLGFILLCVIPIFSHKSGFVCFLVSSLPSWMYVMFTGKCILLQASWTRCFRNQMWKNDLRSASRLSWNQQRHKSALRWLLLWVRAEQLLRYRAVITGWITLWKSSR